MGNIARKKVEREGKRQGKLVGRLLFLFLLVAGCIVFEILTFENFRSGFFKQNAPLFTITACAVTFVGLGVGVLFLLEGRESWYKTFVLTFSTALLLFVALYIVLKTNFLEVLQNPELYREFLVKTGAWMPVLYILLQFLQVVLLPIPSIVSTLAGVALFGAFQATVYSLIGILAGSFLGFFIGRKLGFKAVAWLVGGEKLEVWLRKVKGKDNLILTTMFILPLFPDDILCFIAGLSTMSVRYFSIMIVLARFISVATTCYSVDLILLNTWGGLAIWVGIFAVGIGGFIYLYKNINKINEWLHDRKKKSKKKRTAR